MQWGLALQSLRMNRVRTTLTTLGIIIGVASITLVLSLGGGAEATVRQQVAHLGTDIMLIKPGRNDAHILNLRSYNPYGIAFTTSLTGQDLNAIQRIDGVERVAPIMILDGGVRKTIDMTAITAPIIATTPDLAHSIGITLSSGQFLDNTSERNAVVIGSQLASDLFGDDKVLGQHVYIKGQIHTVIGVTNNTKTPVNLAGIDIDHAVYIGFDGGKSLNQGIAEIQQLIMTMRTGTNQQYMKQTVDAVLFANHNRERDFTILAGDDIMKPSDSMFQTIVLVTSVVASITLVVGGIGIMNIMLVSVSERTREIGLRKALGATNRHILDQFLLEALIMCIVGGLIGLSIAYALAFFIATQLSFQPAVTWSITAIGLGMALSVGVIFGLYPAIKAARKDPIESLRQFQ